MEVFSEGKHAAINFIKFYFFSISCAVIFLGLLINFFEKYLPGFVLKTFRCGKHAYKGTTKLPTIEFPKASFKHFYELGLVCMIIMYIITFSTYILGFKVPHFLQRFLYMLTGWNKTTSNISATKVFIATTLMALQIVRRWYDTHFISIFGKNSKINLTHWGVGITYYPMVILAIICEAPNFSTAGLHRAVHSIASISEIQTFELSEIKLSDIIAITLFMWSWWHQHVCTVILANLRKTRHGTIDDYKIPQGDWFNLLSSPHCTAEILMYIAITVFLWQSSTWWYVMLWIFGNQVESILLSHWWYQETFKNFPINRKALIPYLY